ncbi:hypothetical protein B7759_05942 (plasmid) [Burkholderia glumae]|nr:hypothetical protein B7759_05942 [Burkholderia glumae]
MPGAMLDQPSRGFPAEGTTGARDEVGRAGRQHVAAVVGDAQHHLAHVTALRHRAKRRARSVQRMDRARQRLQLTTRKHRLQFAEQRLDSIARHIRDVERQVACARMMRGDALRRPDLRLAHFQEDARRAERAQAFRDKVAGQCIEHGIDAAAAGARENLVGEAQAARIEAMLDAQSLKHATLGRARGSEHLQPHLLRELDCREADTGGSSVNQDALAPREVAERRQRVVCSQERDGHGGRCVERPVVGYPRHVVGIDDRVRREAPVGHRHHAVADP